MNKLLLNAALALVARLPWADLLEVLKTMLARRLNGILLEQIERLVALAERTEMRGTEKLAWVRAALSAADSPVRSLVASTPGYLVGWAIESALVRLRTAVG